MHGDRHRTGHIHVVRSEKAAMIRVLYDESSYPELFMTYLLSRNARIQAD